MTASAVSSPVLAKQLQDEIAPRCDADECSDVASWIAWWERCEHGPNTLLLCQPHKETALHLKASHCIWECLQGDCTVSLLSVEAL